MKIAVYGGTFNPPHIGHTEAIKAVIGKLDINKAIIIPDNIPPHKDMEANAPTAEQRMEMTRMAFAGIDKCEVSGMEIEREGLSYTYQTIDRLKEQYPEADLYLVIGSDMLLSFKTWKRYEYILENCHLACISRKGDDFEELRRNLLGDSVLIENEPVVVSSSEIRKDVEKNKKYLDEKVYDYIVKERLYSEKEEYFEKRIPIDDTYMNVIRFGKGDKNLIILPGISLTVLEGIGKIIEKTYRLLENDFTVYLVDRRKNLPEKHTTRDMAEDVYRVMKELGVNSASVYGVSHGGMTAQSLAIMHSDFVEKMVLCSSCAKSAESFISVCEGWYKLTAEYNVRELNRDFYRKLYTEEFQEKNAEAIKAAEGFGSEEDCERLKVELNACIAFDEKANLKEIKCPVLVLGAENDKVTGAPACYELAKELDCEIYMYEKYGHAVYDEASEDIEKRMLGFLTE